MSWASRTYAGVTYTFNHLTPFTFGAHGKRIRVHCGAHAFTYEWKPGHPAAMLFMDGKTKRTFDPVRYNYSTHLPAAIIAGAGGHVFSKKVPPKSYVFKASIPGLKGTYVIAFEVRKSRSPKYDVVIQLLSAHLTQSVARMHRAQFSDVLDNRVNGTAVPWTKK